MPRAFRVFSLYWTRLHLGRWEAEGRRSTARHPHALMTNNAAPEPKFLEVRPGRSPPMIRIRYIMEYFIMDESTYKRGQKARKCRQDSRVGQFDAEPVIGRLDVGREPAAQFVVIEIGMQVGQNRALGFEALDPIQRFRDAQVAQVRLVAERIEDPDVEAFEGRDAVGRQTLEIAAIGQAAEAKAERSDVAMVLEDGQGGDWSSLPLDVDHAIWFQPVLADDRRILAAGRRGEAIAEAGVHDLRDALVEPNRHALAAVDEQAAQIVDAVGMVGMFVGEEHGVEPIDAGVEQLLAQVRRGIDQHAGDAVAGAALHQERRAPAAILWIVGIAHAPAERGPWDAAG